MDPQARIDDLIRKYLDRRASDAERRELERLLVENPADAHTFAQVSRMDSWLAGLIQDESRIQNETAFVRAIERRHSEATWLGWLGRRSRQVWTSAATIVVVALGVSAWLLAPRPAAALARLASVRGEVSIVAQGIRTQAQPGQPLFVGQGLQITGEESSAVILYPDGTRLEVGADTTLSDLSGGPTTRKGLFLVEGWLTAEVAPQPPDRPMLLVTPQAELIVQGTRFSLSNDAGVTRAEIKQGSVQLTRKSDGQSIKVPAGFGAVTGNGEPLASQPLPPSLGAPRLTFPGFGEVVYSPDGRTLALLQFKAGGVVLCDAATGQERVSLAGHPPRVYAGAFSPDGRTLATGGFDQAVKLWDVATGQLVCTLSLDAVVYALAFVGGRDLVVLAGSRAEALTFNEQGSLVQRRVLRSGLSSVCAFSPDGRMLAVTPLGDKPSAALWDLAAGRTVREFSGLVGGVHRFAFSPDGKRLAIGHGGKLTVWDLATGEIRCNISGLGGRVMGVAHSPDGALLATGYVDGTVRLWDIATGEQRTVVEAYTARNRVVDRAYALAFSPNGRTLATCEPGIATGQRLRNGVVLLWDLPQNAAAQPREPDRLAPWKQGVQVKRVCNEEQHSIHAYFNTSPESPDGRWVLFYASMVPTGHEGDICVLERATGKVKVLARGVVVEDAHRAACQQWVSGGRRVVFHNRLANGEWVVQCVDLNGGREQTLARGRQVGFGQPLHDLVPLYGPHWDPGEHRDLELLNVVTGEIRKTSLTASAVRQAYAEFVNDYFGDKPISIFFPLLSPDLNRVLVKLATPAGGDFRSKQASLREGLVGYSLKSSRFLFMERRWGHPAWHPDSVQVLNVPGVFIDSNTGARAAIHNRPSLRGSHPSVSPDGDLFASDALATSFGGPATSWAVGVGDVHTGAFVVLHQFDNSHGARSWRVSHPHPTFSADGRRLYFNVSQDHWTRLYVAEVAHE